MTSTDLKTTTELWHYGRSLDIQYRKGVTTMWAFGRIVTGVAGLAFLTTASLGCAARQPEIRDTWTAASQQASQAASQAEASAGRAEAAAGRAEAAATRAETAAQRVESAAARVEAMLDKMMMK